MPIGSFTIVPHLAHELSLRQPRRVLDLGMGSGFLGAVVRQWVDLGVRPWRSFLLGVEGWADYRNPLWDLYDVVVVDSIQSFLAGTSERFDCVLLCDVLEHFPKEEGLALLARCRPYVQPGGLLVVATPAEFIDQPAEYGNPLECHRSLWDAGELEALGLRIVLSGRERQVAFTPTLLAFWSPLTG